MRRREPLSLMDRKYVSMLTGGTLTMLMASVLLMSSSVIAGIALGPEAVEGITLAMPLYSLSAFVGSVFALGVPIIYSAEIGRFNRKEADRAFGFGLLSTMAAGVVLFLLITLLGDAFLRSVHPTEATLAYAQGYLSWMRFTVLLLPMQLLLAEMVYADGDEGISTLSSIVEGIGNPLLSWFLSRSMGIRGISLASFLFVAVSIGVMGIHFLKKRNTLRVSLCFSFGMLRKTVRYSLIESSSYLFLGLLSLGANWFVIMHFGPEYLILVSLASFCRELQMVFDGIGEAIKPIIGIYRSERCTKGTRHIYRIAQRTAVLEGIAMTLFLLVSAPYIARWLGITDPDMLSLATAGLRILGAGSVFVGLLYLSTAYYLVTDRIRLGLMICAMRDILVTAPLSMGLALAFGPYGFLVGVALAPLIAWGLITLKLRSRYPEEAPMFLGRQEAGSLLYSLAVEPEEILRVRDRVGQDLTEQGYDQRTVRLAMLLTEELLMLLYERNRGRRVLAECGVLTKKDRIRMIFRDSGARFDIADADGPVSSLRRYVIANVTQQMTTQGKFLTAMSFNRNAFELPACRHQVSCEESPSAQ